MCVKKRRQQRGARQSAAPGSVRIIAGRWKGRRLTVASVPGLRPTGDRIRETLFSWLQFELGGAHCLDLFAGSGALGLEAASRGAASVTLIENDTTAARALEQHVESLDAGNVQIIRGDAARFIVAPDAGVQTMASVEGGDADRTPGYHCVFLDPPFQQQLHQPILELLANSRKLAENALVYIESATDERYVLPDCMEVVRSSKAGNVQFQLVRVRKS